MFKKTLSLFFSAISVLTFSMPYVQGADSQQYNSQQAVNNHRLDLIEAIKKGDLIRVEDLVFSDTNLVNSVDDSNRRNTMLHLAAGGGHVKVIDFLINERANLNEQNRHRKTPLHEAVANKHSKVVERLLKHGDINPNLQDVNGNTPLHMAIENQDVECILYLLDHGSLDPSIKNTISKQTPDELLNSQTNSARSTLHPGAKAIQDAMEPFANIKVKDILKKPVDITLEMRELADKIRSDNRMIFLSYCWGKKHSVMPMVDDFEEFLIEIGLKENYFRDKRETEGFGMTPGVSIRGFMDKAKDSHGVIIFLNEEYLKSWNCMYEFWQVWDVEKRKPKPTATIIRHPDCTNIFGQTGHTEYTKHWSQALLDLENRQDGLTLDAKGSHVEAAREADKLKRNMEPIIGWLAGHILSDYRTMRQKGFKEVLRNIIEPGVEIAAEESLVRQAIKQFEELNKREKENRDRIETIKEELQKAKESHDKNEKDKQEIRKQIEDLKKGLKSNEGSNNDSKNKAIEELTVRLNTLVEKDKEDEGKAETLRKDQERLQQEKTALDIALTQLKVQFATIEQEYKKFQEEENKNRLDLLFQVNELKQQANADNPQILKMQTQIESLQKELEDLQVKFITTTNSLGLRITTASNNLEIRIEQRQQDLTQNIVADLAGRIVAETQGRQEAYDVLDARITTGEAVRQATDGMLRKRITLEYVPFIALGYEEVYHRFVNGILVYSPNKMNDEGVIKLPIAELENPLEGTFDLSKCGDTSQHLTISTGYPKEEKPIDGNKVDIWIALRFVIEKQLSAAKSFQQIMSVWDGSDAVGIFWAGSGDSSLSNYCYLKQNMDKLSNINLYEKYGRRVKSPENTGNVETEKRHLLSMSRFKFIL